MAGNKKRTSTARTPSPKKRGKRARTQEVQLGGGMLQTRFPVEGVLVLLSDVKLSTLNKMCH